MKNSTNQYSKQIKQTNHEKQEQAIQNDIGIKNLTNMMC